MEKINGHHSSQPVDIPVIIVTDYDAELANQQYVKHESKDHADDGSESSPNPSVVNESEEEDREIIESLTKAHSTNSERHVDVDEMIASAIVKSECEKENFMTETLTEKKELPTDDDMADMEVSHLTSLLESKNVFVPVSGTILNLQRPTVQPPPMAPMGALPDVSDVSLPRLVPRIKKPSLADLSDPSDMLAEIYFPALGEMSFSAECEVDSRFNRSECLPTNGVNKIKNRRTARLYGESENESHYSSSSSSDEQPPQYWKLHADNASEKLDGGSKEDISQILNTFHVVENGTVDDNAAPPASNDSQHSNFSLKQSEDENKK